MKSSSERPSITKELVDELVSDYRCYADDLRTVERQSIQLPVKLYYFDEQRIVEFAVTRDISTHGVGLLTRRAVRLGLHLHIELQALSGDLVQAPCKVVHCTAFGPFFHVGCYFMDRSRLIWATAFFMLV